MNLYLKLFNNLFYFIISKKWERTIETVNYISLNNLTNFRWKSFKKSKKTIRKRTS